MGRAISRSGAAQPTPHRSDRRPRGDGRLDPVRWRRPARGTLIRLSAVAALLALAALVSWSPSREQSCDTGTGAAASPPSTAAAPSSSERASPAPPVLPSGSVGVPVRLADPTALSLVRPGDHVDLLRTGPQASSQPVASAALVLGVTGAGDLSAGGLLLALTPAEARDAVTAPADGFAIVIRPG